MASGLLDRRSDGLTGSLFLHGRIDSLQVTGGVLAVSGDFDRL